MVVVGRSVRADGVDSVMTDEELGAKLVVDHLVALGHRADRPHRRRARRRRRAAAAGLPQGDGSGRSGALRRGAPRRLHRTGRDDGGGALLARRRLPTAVFAANDLVAVGAIDALERSGYEVPGDVSVVGYDNTFFARLRHVSLTTVDQPREEMGRLALGLLVDRIAWRRRRLGARADDTDAGHPGHDRAPVDASGSTPSARLGDRDAHRRRPAAPTTGRGRAADVEVPSGRLLARRPTGERHRGRRRLRAHRGPRRARASTVTVDGTPGVVVAVDHGSMARRSPCRRAAPRETAASVAYVYRQHRRPAGRHRAPVVASIDEPIDGVTYRRRASSLDGNVTHGDSGSGVFGLAGLLGMVFAVSTRDPSVAYAVRVQRAAPFIEQHVGLQVPSTWVRAGDRARRCRFWARCSPDAARFCAQLLGGFSEPSDR